MCGVRLFGVVYGVGKILKSNLMWLLGTSKAAFPPLPPLASRLSFHLLSPTVCRPLPAACGLLSPCHARATFMFKFLQFLLSEADSNANICALDGRTDGDGRSEPANVRGREL